MQDGKDSSSRLALIERATASVDFYFHRIPDSKYLFGAVLTRKKVVIVTSYAQRIEGDYVAEVAREYCRQELEAALAVILDDMQDEKLLEIINA